MEETSNMKSRIVDFVQRCCNFCWKSFCVTLLYFLFRALSSGNGVGSSKDKVGSRNVWIRSVISSLLWSSQLSRKKWVFERHSGVSVFSPSAVFRSRGLVSRACGQPGSCLCLRTHGDWSSATKSWAWKEEVGTWTVSVLFKAVCWSAVCVPVCVCSYTVPWGKELLVCFSRLHHIPKDCHAEVCSAGDRFTAGSLCCKNHSLRLTDQFKYDLLHQVCVTTIKGRVCERTNRWARIFPSYLCFSFWRFSDYQNRIKEFLTST